MPIQVLMPALSPTMTEGNLAKWHKTEGEAVASGDVLAEIETDKATMEVEAVDEGILGKILVAEGAHGVAVNTPIALILEDGEDPASLDDRRLAKVPGGAQAAAGDGAAAGKTSVAEKGATAGEESAPAPTPFERGTSDRVFASPLARRIAADAGLEIKSITGSGPRGRVVKADVEAAIAGGGAKTLDGGAKPTPTLAEAPGLPAFEVVPLTTMRKVIAQRLTESKREAPHFYLTVDCEIDKLLAVRKELNGASDAYKISVNDFVVRACALALREVPAANAAWAGDSIRLFQRADVSVAVAIPDGLITPVIRSADEKRLVAISNEMKDLAGRAREGKLAPEEYQGGTFSLSNLGMFGIKEFSAVINPPQACILAVGAGTQRAVVKDGALAVATVMASTLSIDHRAVDGAVGAQFLAAYKRLIENPLSILL